MAGPCNWRSPNDSEITTMAEAQELGVILFTVCNTNLEVIQKRQEGQVEAELKCQREEAPEARAVNSGAAILQRALDQQTLQILNC